MRTNCHSCGDEYEDDVLEMQAQNAALKAQIETLRDALEFCAGTSYITDAHDVANAALGNN